MVNINIKYTFDYYYKIVYYLSDMCIQLQLEEYLGIKKSVVNNLGKYWNKRTECDMNPKEIPEIL